MKLTIVRHGETIENSLGICQGQSEGTLSEKGMQQAKLVAERLKDEKFDIAISSDLKRAAETAQAILEHHAELSLHLDKRLRERFFGALQGNKSPNYDINDHLPNDAESNEAIVARHAEFYHEILGEYKNKHILIVSHGIAKKALLTAIFNLDPEKLNELERFGNTSVSVVEIENEISPKSLLRNCMAHLNLQ